MKVLRLGGLAALLASLALPALAAGVGEPIKLDPSWQGIRSVIDRGGDVPMPPPSYAQGGLESAAPGAAPFAFRSPGERAVLLGRASLISGRTTVGGVPSVVVSTGRR